MKDLSGISKGSERMKYIIATGLVLLVFGALMVRIEVINAKEGEDE